jgi:rhodanese-related sulfurtransferase
MKKLIIVALLLLLVFPIAVNGCDYITGQALSLSETYSYPRWLWSSIDGVGTVIDIHTGQFIKDVTPKEAFLIIGSSSLTPINPVVLDVRTAEEYTTGHLWEAINIDYNSPNFITEISQLNKNVTYVVYCYTGYRSNLARNIMKELGFNYVINITGGLNAWMLAGIPVAK